MNILQTKANLVCEISKCEAVKGIGQTITCVLNDKDLGRVILRKEVLFYHQVLERSLDHLLQALFALNRTYFPSRKRMEEYIHGFENKPINCYERLIKIIEMAASSETMVESVRDLKELTREIQLAEF